MRALLVANPAASTTGPRVREVLSSALASEHKLEIAETGHRGHAWELAAEARADGLDLVVVLGGDGTINEAVNGLLAAGPDPDATPALAIVPGGYANVAARALGLPPDPVESTGLLLEALRAGRQRVIGLGRADERYFTFCAGLGMDAAAVRRVEDARLDRRVSSGRYMRAAAREVFFTSRRRPPLVLAEQGEPDEPVFVALVCNTRPWTYIGDRPVDPCPEASFDLGLDVFAMRRMGTVRTLVVVGRMLWRRGGGPRGRSVLLRHDRAAFTVSATRPLAAQVDGDYLDERTSLSFAAVPRALRVVA